MVDLHVYVSLLVVLSDRLALIRHAFAISEIMRLISQVPRIHRYDYQRNWNGGYFKASVSLVKSRDCSTVFED